ncbi:putative CDP-diacylglycerol-glycerol-3-phosphate 3-phosphatidyltransferase [Kockovaella imperatae]|uniref:CDP-diacylglycerol--glycerol-3-phosphate 3-phosphatidyltransferase n=1 Tax=Kockovaella imperatae TaxID=4999 RepID=A0A1Y1UH24_9TREE|nr:putative CDP-diacylglycerol-glycerol-3-phosphate 3-phosphatidyltransferase [Kockovaella imperatae]ORX37348.1 putative CDP-diacylglycerol-glycerol-3-phosphate 3-phosphatidyltransferase [Kockovaella imperatae]
MARPPAFALRACQEITAGPSRIVRQPTPAKWIRAKRFKSTETNPSGTTSYGKRYDISDSSAAGQSPLPSPSSASKPPSTLVPSIPHAHPAFTELANTLCGTLPCFGARGDEIHLLSSPEEFKTLLLDMIKRAKRRILISSLYIGVEETELVEAIREALERRPQLRVTIILDYHRATRLSNSGKYAPSTAHLLLPLLAKFGDRCDVWLFRSPKLRGLLEKIVPERYDEGWGTWHGKWYGVDDEVVISGANLAGSYFTNRQDRYIHFTSHPSLLSYLTTLTRLFSHYSYYLTASPLPSVSRNHLVSLPSPPSSLQFFGSASLVWPQPSIHPRGFGRHAKATLTAFQRNWRESNPSRLRRVDVDTWFWPVIQAGVLGMKEEETALGRVFDTVKTAHQTALTEESPASNEKGKGKEGVAVDLTSGYFGLYKAYKRAVVESPAPFRLIAASPKANGFYGSAGLSRLIPEGYTLLESRFWADLVSRGRTWQAITSRGVRLREWEKEGWTYHAKGIWLSPAEPIGHPFMTFIGSSNLSTRSLQLDTELSLLLSTSSPSLRRALGNEVKSLDKHATDVSGETWQSEDRRVSFLAKVLVALGVEGML